MSKKRRCKALSTARLVFDDKSVVDITKDCICWLTDKQIKEHKQFVVLDEIEIIEKPVEKKAVVEESKCEKCQKILTDCKCLEEVIEEKKEEEKQPAVEDEPVIEPDEEKEVIEEKKEEKPKKKRGRKKKKN